MRTLQEMTLQEKLGQRLAAGFQGLEPPEEFLRLIKEYKVGNIILFRRNIQDGPQLKKLCATLRKVVEEETGVTPFITIDQEGGVVTRLPESEVNIPGAMAVAATGNPRNAYDMGLLTAQELRSCGVDFNLAPVMDINCNPDNPVIGVRSYGDTPERVAEYGSQMVRGLLDGGVADSIPIRFFESIGYKRNLIILTQPKGFVKKKNPMLPVIRARYLRYPAFVEAVADRHERYNETLSYISMLEQSGRAFVIRPPIPLEIPSMERDPAQLRRVYETGRAVAQIQIDKIAAYVEESKAATEE